MSNSPTGFGIAKENYKILLAGVALIAVGYLLMMGGGSDDPNVFNPEIFSTRRIVVAPVVCLVGFVVILVAIMRKPKNKAENAG
jgi:hypothetical protein